MRKSTGSTSFTGRIAYCPQIAWIQSCSIRDNILFGRPFDEGRYWGVVREAELEGDFGMFALVFPSSLVFVFARGGFSGVLTP